MSGEREPTTARGSSARSRTGRAQASDRSASRSTKSGTGGSNGSRRSAAATGRRSGAATQRGSRPTARRRSSAATRNAKPSSRRASENGSGRASLVVPMATGAIGGAAGLVGGALFARRARSQRRRVLGIPMPGTGGVDGLAKQVGEAAKQFGRLAGEVHEARERAEKVGKALS